MTTITMYDSIDVNSLPKNASAYAGYVGGSWPTYNTLKQMFPHAHLLSIAPFASEDAMCLDVEPGDATDNQVVPWVQRQFARKVYRPVIYSSADNMENGVIPVLANAKIARSSVRLWSAHYGQGDHICGPNSCGLLSTEADGTQWTDQANGINLDQSTLLANFFTVPGPPKPPGSWTYGPPQNLTDKPGHTNVELSWKEPLGAPAPPAYYEVFIYEGLVCDTKTIVPTYPRKVTGTSVSTGGLKRHTQYTAHVLASGPNNTHVKPYTFATVVFTTG